MKTIKKSDLYALINEAHSVIRGEKGGKNADYIPYLAQIDSNLFGIAVALPDGTVMEVGDTNYQFGIESISKVPTAILAMEQNGSDELLTKIGADATGLPFNSIMAILLENDKPSTPLVNSGAISAVSMIKPTGNSTVKWKAITDFMTAMCGSPLTLIEELYKSESATNFNNRSIAWLLKNYGKIYDSPDLSLDLYTRQCSLGVTARQLAVAGATIACRGQNPTTKERVFSEEHAPMVVSLIATVGFYEHTGDWLFQSGVPAKTGVGGGVMGIVPSGAAPGGFGIAAFSPPLDNSGNSVRAQMAIKYIARKLGVNVFKGEDIVFVD